MSSTTVAEASPGLTPDPKKKRRPFSWVRLAHSLEKLGLGFFAPYARLIGRDEPQKQVREIGLGIALPAVAIGLFLAFWSFCSTRVVTDSWKIPSPTETWTAFQGMREFAANEKVKAGEFREKMNKMAVPWYAKASEAKAAGDSAKAKELTEKAKSYETMRYPGPPTYGQQIKTSLLTVAIGFLIATIIAVPIGVLCGLVKNFNTAVNPLIQIFKPVSPLAWLPIVFVFVTVLYNPSDGAKNAGFGREIFISAGTVTLCSLWPTLINTAFGVAGIDRDHLNVARVLKLSWWQRIVKIVLPAALPLMFTGLRLSLGVGWMVLIAADMLAQNPGLGKFVWDTFQNGSTESMAQIVVAVFTIGIIGFILDRIMFSLQRLVSFDDQAF
ncbi:MAG: ABC transporter permease subunit [Verrucomicrobiota bacterium]